MNSRSLYVAKSSAGPIKIGVAADVPKRLQALRVSSPYHLTLILSLPHSHAFKLEHMCHSVLRDHRLSGEWFDISSAKAIEIVRTVVATPSLFEGPPVVRVWRSGKKRGTPITRHQCRAARMLLEWEQTELASAAGLSTRTIQIFENAERAVGTETLGAITDALVRAGCLFLDGNGVSRPHAAAQ